MLNAVVFGNYVPHTHAHSCSRDGDFEELILLVGSGRVTGSQWHDELVELRSAGSQT